MRVLFALNVTRWARETRQIKKSFNRKKGSDREHFEDIHSIRHEHLFIPNCGTSTGKISNGLNIKWMEQGIR